MTFPGSGILLDILKGSVATIALFLAYATVPLFGVIGGMFAPLPGILFTLRGGRVVGAAIVLVTSVTLALVGDLSVTALYLVQCATVSLLLPIFLTGRTTSRAIVYTASGSLATMLALGIGFAVIRGVNLDAQVVKWLNASISQTAAIYAKSGLKGEDLEAFQQAMQQGGVFLGRAYPALVVISQLFIVMLNVLALNGFSRRWQLPVVIEDFRQFRNPEQLVWIVIVAGFSLLINNDIVARTALNLLLVGLFAYFIQGMAVIAHFFDRFSVPALGRYLLYFFLALQPYLAVVVAALGLFDLWGNFRAPRNVTKEP